MTQVNINEATVTLNVGEAGEFSVDVAALIKSEAVANYIFQYGLKQMLNDVHASVTKKVEADDAKRVAQKRGLIQNKYDSLLAGNVARERIASSDPVGKLMREMAEADVKKAILGAGKKVSDFTKDSFKAATKAMLDKRGDSYRKAAEAKLAIKVEGKSDINILDLLN